MRQGGMKEDRKTKIEEEEEEEELVLRGVNV